MIRLEGGKLQSGTLQGVQVGAVYEISATAPDPVDTDDVGLILDRTCPQECRPVLPIAIHKVPERLSGGLRVRQCEAAVLEIRCVWLLNDHVAPGSRAVSR